MILSACARSVSTHHARSSKAEGSNSKLLNHTLARQIGWTLLGSQQALLHRLGLEQVCRLPLRFDFAPEPNRDNDGGWFAGLIGHDLDVGVFHAFSVPPPAATRPPARPRVASPRYGLL